MRVYKLYATATSTADNVANVLITRNCRIRSIRWHEHVDAPADNAFVAVELSTRPTSQFTTNDSQGDITQRRHSTNLTTSGAFDGGNDHQELLDFPVAAGERIYVHAIVSGTVTWVGACFIDVVESSR